MAGNSSSGSTAMVLLQQIPEKLSKNNHAIWRAQVLATLRGARLEDFITGRKKAPAAEIEVKEGDTQVTIANPEYEDWWAADQQVLSFILASVSKDILICVTAAKSAADAWKTSEGQLASQTRARVVNTSMALATTHKGNLSVAEYLVKMQGLGNDMAIARRPLDDEDLVQYILVGLDEDYDFVVNSVLARPLAISVSE
jgi:hypothetical protein